MRVAIAFAILAGGFLVAPQSAQAGPLALGDHAALSRDAAVTHVTEVARPARYSKRRSYGKRRYNWTYLPYWRPYQYRYWQFYYPYGGPLF